MDHHPDDWTFGRVLEERQTCVCARVHVCKLCGTEILISYQTSVQATSLKLTKQKKRLMVTTYNLSQEDGMATNLILRF